MKLEKRIDGAGDAPSSQKYTEENGKHPVFLYIFVLFIAAFLLMALSFFMHQRSNEEAMGNLQNSVAAMQTAQNAQDKIIQLQEELAQAQKAIESLEKDAEDLRGKLTDTEKERQAYWELDWMQQLYELGLYDDCQTAIQHFEAAGYAQLLPVGSGDGHNPGRPVSPHAHYEQLKEAVAEKLAEAETP